MRLREKARSDGDIGALGRNGALAFDFAERGRARALLDLMMATTGLDRVGLPAELVARWREASAAVALSQERLAGASQRGAASSRLTDLALDRHRALGEVRAVEAELERVNPRFWAAVNPQADVSSLDAVTAVLPPGTTLIQYVTGQQNLLAWAVTRDGMVAEHRFRGKHRLQGMVRDVVEGCAHGGDYEEPATLLAEMLLKPLRAAIEASTSLFVVPAGPLMRLPFAVLPWNGATLGEACPITVVPSASALCTDRAEGRDRGRPLVVGDPEGMEFRPAPGQPPVPLPPLPGTRLEAAYIGCLLTDASVLIGENATEERVRKLLPEASVVHFATHGILDAESRWGPRSCWRSARA